MADPLERLRTMQEKVREILDLARTELGFVAGSVYEAHTRCGRRGCRCMGSDYRHVNRCVSFRDEGRSRTRTLPERLAADAAAAADAYRNARAARRLIARTGEQLLRDIDALIAEATDRGQRRMLEGLQQAGKDVK